MKEAEVKKVINKLTRRLSRQGVKTADGFEKDHIHEFRVAAKSLRSFLRFVAHFMGNNNYKLPRKFIRLYHVAGAIRDVQLEYEKALQLPVTIPGYSDHLAQVIREQKKHWEQHYSKKIFSRMDADLCSIITGAIPLIGMSEFHNAKRAAVATIIAGKTVTDNQLHQIRKEIKDIIYTNEVLSKKEQQAIWQNCVPYIGQLKLLSDDIGDYNDERIMMAHIRSFGLKLEKAEDREQTSALVAAMAKNLKLKKNMLKKEIVGYFNPVPKVVIQVV